MKHLIVGLGNIGTQYDGTRHNIGFRVIDTLAINRGISFEDRRYGFVGKGRIKNQELVLLKPTTFMNLSGNAVRYWMQQEKIEADNIIVVCDDLSLPFGKLRLREGGSAGGHNGLKNINEMIGTEKYPRLKFGIGSNYHKGQQIDFVLGQFTDEEEEKLPYRVAIAVEAIEAACLSSVVMAMNGYNNK